MWEFWYKRHKDAPEGGEAYDDSHVAEMDNQDAANQVYDFYDGSMIKQLWVESGGTWTQGIRDPDGNEVDR